MVFLCRVAGSGPGTWPGVNAGELCRGGDIIVKSMEAFGGATSGPGITSNVFPPLGFRDLSTTREDTSGEGDTVIRNTFCRETKHWTTGIRDTRYRETKHRWGY